MSNIKNNEETRKLIKEKVKFNKLKAMIGMGVFNSSDVNSLTIHNQIGYITDIDLESGYIEWVDQNNSKMPSVNINMVCKIYD